MDERAIFEFLHAHQSGTMDSSNSSGGGDGLDFFSQLKLARQRTSPVFYHASHCSVTARLGFVRTYESLAKNKTKGDCTQYVKSFRPAVEHGVAPSSIADLKQVSILQVATQVNKIHTESVLFVSVIHAPYRLVGTSILVEDDDQNCIMLTLYNYIGNDEDPNDVFHVGSRLALLAPYMRNVEDDRSKNLLLRCDNPQCVLIYDSKDEWLAAKRGEKGGPSPQIEHPSLLREKGNKEFLRQNFQGASKFYSLALCSKGIQSNDKVACWSNRAEVRLRQGRWEEAEEDAQSVLSLQDDHVKAKLRLAKAISRQGKSSKALVIAVQLLAHQSVQDRCIRDFISECRRLREEEEGVYDEKIMRRDVSHNRKEFHADFVSSSADVGVLISTPSGSSYRGCKAVEAIAQADLITASRAFAFTRSSSSKIPSLDYNVYERSVDTQNTTQLVGDIVQLLKNNPCLGREFYSLSAGEDYPVVRPMDLDKIDLARIRRILNSNSFSEAYENEAIVDKWEQLQKTKNLGRLMTKLELEQEQAAKKELKGSGVWLQESKFNHSCTPNCVWTQIGDHMFIRSTRAIKAGEELCISYTPVDTSYENCQRFFANWVKPNVGFICACERCHMLRQHSNLLYLEAEVEEAYQKAAEEVTLSGVPMAKAGDRSISSYRRRQIMAAFAPFPLHLQHNTVVKLLVLEGACFKHRGDDAEALNAYERAADIGYAVRGGTGFGYFTDLWRVTGAAMACKKLDLAYHSLKTIWDARDFKALPVTEAKTAFLDLTLKYATPWWKDDFNIERQRRLESLVKDVCSEKCPKKGAQKSNRKKKGRNKSR
jgi:tetratricopeptide (TPR) repeat protein